MATTYVDPGSYIQRRNEPGSISVSSDRNLAIVAIGPRTKRVTDEAVIRGKVYDETLTVSGSSPYEATLTNICDRNRNNAKLYMNGNEVPIGNWSFNSAAAVGNDIPGTDVDTSVKKKFTLSMDGKPEITIDLTSGATTALSVIASDINTALAASPIYGAAYAAVATATTKVLTITSPLTTSASDVKILLSYEDDLGTYEDAASLISATAWNPTMLSGYQAPTILTIVDVSYSSTATYTIEYTTVDVLVDPLASAATGTPLSDIARVGTYPGSASYLKNTDYEETGNTVDWDTSAWVNSDLVGTAGTYNITGTNDTLLLAINGGAQITVTLTTGAAQTAANVAEDINLALNASADYGPLYSHCAYVSGGTTIGMTVPAPYANYPVDKGESSIVVFYTVANNAFTTLFGIPAASLPYESRGAGNRPAFATTYYTSYDHDRDSDDYNNPTAVYSVDQLIDYTSPLTLTNYTVNKLAIAGELVFQNRASSCILVQIDDETVPGTPSTAQIRAAIDACEESSSITEIVVIDTSLDSAVYLQNHVSNMSSMLKGKPRRGWYGMARGTEIGDPDTPDTLIYRSKVTLQPGATSQGRGRQILCGPTEYDRILTMEDESELTVQLDGSYMAAAVAGYFTSLGNPSDAMVGDEIVGFEIPNFETYLDGERHQLADSGVLVVTMRGGRALMLDPLTTEAGGGKVVGFEEPQSTVADDVVTKTVNNTLDTNVKGIVPDDLADFISDIKTWIKHSLEAVIEAKYIAPYRNPNNTVRPLNPKTDIQVFQSASDPRTYTFRYWYNRKYPAKRFFGEYSVDNPFWVSNT